MKSLNAKQRNRFITELESLEQSDPTCQFLNECAIGLRKSYDQQLNVHDRYNFQAYVQAEHILRRHTAYLAYRLGFQHGKESK